MSDHLSDTLTLDLRDYLGGVAIWGAIPAVFNSTHHGFDEGIHVHARKAASRKKVIDHTFSSLTIHHNGVNYLICKKSAMSFATTALFGIEMVELPCARCGIDILDEDINSVLPTQEHHCSHCHFTTFTETPCVANPLIRIKKLFDDVKTVRDFKEPDRSISLDDDRFTAGGIQLWGSNPAIVWTSPTCEEKGIHVHAYDSEKKRIIDNTYSHVQLCGEKLEVDMIQMLQAQQALPSVNSHLGSCHCPHCHKAIFHQGKYAVTPNTQHQCADCHTVWNTAPIISNPAFSLLQKYKEVCYL